MTGDVDLDVTVFDVVGGGIIGELLWHQAEDADTCSVGADLDIDGVEFVHDFLRQREQSAVRHAVVEVNACDAVHHTNADAVIARCGYRRTKGCEGGWIIGSGFTPGDRVIGDFGLPALDGFIPPAAPDGQIFVWGTAGCRFGLLCSWDAPFWNGSLHSRLEMGGSF